MAPGAQVWWTDERVEETVTSAYIHSHLRTNEQEYLKQPLFGGDLTDDTYLDWILNKAKRIFLILVATGVPDQIFGVVDDSFDDDDLPIAEDFVQELRLSFEPDRSLDKRFYKTQFRFLTRIVGDGEHIRYADEETVPVLPLGLKSVIGLSKDGTDTVKLPSDAQKVFVRKRVVLDSRLSEEDALAEIAGMKKFSHEHVISVFGSYLHQGTLSILFIPAAEYTLKHFLTDLPKAFEVSSKTERRQTLITWPHCLASALAWLHGNDGHHGAIRPSNVHVDQYFRISLGFLDGEGLICQSAKSDDIEAYQYAAPERWKRAVTVQSTGSSIFALPSGSRTTRQPRLERWYSSEPNSGRQSASATRVPQFDLGGPGGASYAFLPASKGTFARLRLSTANHRELRDSSSTRDTKKSIRSDDGSITSSTTVRRMRELSIPSKATSITSSISDDARRKAVISPTPTALFVAAPESRTAVVQTWRSVEHDSFAADVFSIGAVIMDILTVLCKRTYSSFARFRSAKNRNAGRGGGLADASFHANLGQVLLWAQAISSEAEKKSKKNDNQVFSAVGPVIQLTVQCLEKSPDARLSAAKLARKLGEHVKRFAKMNVLHCVVEPTPEKERSLPLRRKGYRDHQSFQDIQNPSERSHSRSDSGRKYEVNLPKITLTSTAPPVLPTPDASVGSFTSFNFDLDGHSDTVVGDAPSTRHTSWHHRQYRGLQSFQESEDWGSQEADINKVRSWKYYQQNDSAVDPALTPSDAGDKGTFTYINYSTGTSSDEDEADVFMYPLPPTQAPDRKLPPIPTKERDVPRLEKPLPHVTRAPQSEPTTLQNSSKATVGGNPTTVSSLQQAVDGRTKNRTKVRGVRYSPMSPENSTPKLGREQPRVYRNKVTRSPPN